MKIMDEQSESMWIRPPGSKPRHNSIDFTGSGSFGSRFGRSMSVNSEGASTQDSSPPYSPVDMSSSMPKSRALNIPDGGGRYRTSSFSSGYGNEREEMDKDPYLIHSPLSTSAPGLFRRSNSISVGALEYNNSKYGGYDQYGGRNGGRGNLGPIDEVGKMSHFSDAIKKSMGSLFSVPKLPPKTASALGSSPNQKQKGAMTDRVVSMLCENSIR